MHRQKTQRQKTPPPVLSPEQAWIKFNRDLHAFLVEQSSESEYCAKLLRDLSLHGSIAPAETSTAKRLKAKLDARRLEQAAKTRQEPL